MVENEYANRFLAIFFVFVLAPSEGYAQQDPRPILKNVIHQLQTGTPNPQWYGPQLWNTIAVQTGATGIYWPLRALGPVKKVTLNGQIQLPGGPVYSLTAEQWNGFSYWHLGISRFTQRIEYALFMPSLQPLPQPPPDHDRPPPDDGRPPPDDGRPPPDSQASMLEGSAACQRFPILC